MGGLGEGLGFIMGGVLGLALWYFPQRLRMWTWGLSSVLLGAGVSWVNGELPLWPGCLALDVPIVASTSAFAFLAMRQVSKSYSRA